MILKQLAVWRGAGQGQGRRGEQPGLRRAAGEAPDDVPCTDRSAGWGVRVLRLLPQTPALPIDRNGRARLNAASQCTCTASSGLGSDASMGERNLVVTHFHHTGRIAGSVDQQPHEVLCDPARGIFGVDAGKSGLRGTESVHRAVDGRQQQLHAEVFRMTARDSMETLFLADPDDLVRALPALGDPNPQS